MQHAGYVTLKAAMKRERRAKDLVLTKDQEEEADGDAQERDRCIVDICVHVRLGRLGSMHSEECTKSPAAKNEVMGIRIARNIAGFCYTPGYS